MNTSEPEIFSIDELAEKYPRQWLAVNVLERDSESGQPLKVKLLTKGIDLYSVRNKVGTNDFCTLYTGPIPEINHVGMF